MHSCQITPDLKSQNSIPLLDIHDGNYSARYRNYKLLSAFQPIYSIAHKRIVGLEGLLRTIDTENNMIQPWVLFNQINNDEVFFLDKLCHAIHIENFMALDTKDIWIFLNVNPHSLREVETFVEYLRQLIIQNEFNPHRIVIEVLENSTHCEKDLEDAIKIYKNLGCLIAIDDFGAGHSNFERIWRIEPDIVKIDQGLVKKAGMNQNIQSMLKSMVSLLHENRCIVLAEGIENEKEAIACMEANVDLVQGFYFSKPFLLSESMKHDRKIWYNLYDIYNQYSREYNQHYNDEINLYKKVFSNFVCSNNIKNIADRMFKLERTIRLYQITEDGNQNLANIVSPRFSDNTNTKLAPLLRAEGASWRHRPYFKNAIHNPGEIQISLPYLSIPDGKMCITLSVMAAYDSNPFVLCCDIYWDD